MYLLIANKPDGADYCRGCVMDQWRGDFQYFNHLNAERLQEKLAEFLFLNQTDKQGKYDFLIFRNGVKVYDTDTSTFGFTWDGYERNPHEYTSDAHFEFEQKDEEENQQAMADLTEIVNKANVSCQIKINELKNRKLREQESERIRREQLDVESRRQQFEQLKKEFDS